MNFIYAMIGVFLLLIATVVITAMIFNYRKKKNQIVEKDKPQTKKDTKVELVEIEPFNGDDYVNEVFNTVFYSIQNDNWKKEIKYDKISFTKDREVDPNNRYTTNKSSVSVTFSYKFRSKDYDSNSKKLFSIDSIQLSNGGSYTHFTYKKDIPNDVNLFIYKTYSDWINKENEEKRKNIDKDLLNMKSVLGKASTRGSKIDELLGE